MKSILSKSFKYVDSTHTNIRETFEKERIRLRQEQLKLSKTQGAKNEDHRSNEEVQGHSPQT